LCSERERPEDSSMSGPMHFAILAHYSRMRHSHTKLGQRQEKTRFDFERE